MSSENYENLLYRNRSLSCGSPLRHQIVYQEIYGFGKNALVRSVSCNQVFSKDENGQTFETMQIQVSSFISPDKNNHNSSIKSSKKMKLRLDKKNAITDYKPDLVSDDKICTSNVKNKFSYKKNIKSAVIYFLGALCSFFICFYVGHINCNRTWNIKHTYDELQQKVFGQSEAIAKIELVLNECNKTRDLHVMGFTGHVGVGKTYVSSIIYHNFPWSSKKVLFSDDLSSEIYEKLISASPNCGYNLLIYDDLTYKNVEETLTFLSTLYFKMKKNLSILIILIFQTHSEEESNDILLKYKNLYLNYYHIPFQKMTKDAVKQCFLKEIKKQKAIISESELEKLIKEKLNDVDIVKGPTGCKGITDEISHYL